MSWSVLGIDPGKVTGIAVWVDRKLAIIGSFPTFYDFYEWFRENGDDFDIIALEDSRKQSHLFSAKGLSAAATGKVGRNVGMIDMQCQLVQSCCYRHGWDLRLHSPLTVGGKMEEKEFRESCHWEWKRGNQHARDAAIVAKMHRHPEADKRKEERKKLGRQ